MKKRKNFHKSSSDEKKERTFWGRRYLKKYQKKKVQNKKQPGCKPKKKE